MDTKNVIPFPTMDFKAPKMETESVSTVQSAPSFFEMLHSEKMEFKKEETSMNAPEEPHANSNTNSDLGKIDEVRNQTEASEKTPTSANPDKEEDELVEEDLDREALEYSIRIMDFLPKFNEVKPANEIKNTNSEHTGKNLNPKSTEQAQAYRRKEESSSNFLEDTKKLAESLLKKGELIHFADQKSQITEEKKQSNLVMFPNKKEEQSIKIPAHKNDGTVKDVRAKETNHGSISNEAITVKGKEIAVEKKETNVDSVVKEKDKAKLKKNTETSPEDKIKDKDSSQQVLDKNSDRVVRNLGIKDKEFQKSEIQKTQNLERARIETASNQERVQMVQSNQLEGNSSQSSEKRTSGEPVSFGTELRSQLKENIISVEKNKPTKDTNVKQNVDELIKQAKFDIVQNGKSSAEIVMNPKEYGRLTLKVSVEGDRVEGRILVDSEEMVKSLQNEIQTIKENLKESGLELGSLIIDLWDDGNQASSRGQDQDLQRLMIEQAKYRYSDSTKLVEDSNPKMEYIENQTKSMEFFV